MEVEIESGKAEKIEICGTQSSILHSQQSRITTEIPSSNIPSKIMSEVAEEKILDGSEKKSSEGGLKMLTSGCSKTDNFAKNKRKRRRKPKSSNKPYKKSNWKFQMPRSRNRPNSGRNNLMHSRNRNIVPYNTNIFLMEEHMSEVPSALLTPSGRTRDSSFSVDSEDNYLHSVTEDEEEFLTKEFTNVYEKARVERLESMSKQQLIEECLQLEDSKYTQTSDHQSQQNNHIDYINKIKFLEDKIRELTAENLELLRKLDFAQNKISRQSSCQCSSSEDSESDSTSSSSSSCDSSGSRYSRHSSIATNNENDNNNANNVARMEFDDAINFGNDQNQLENENEIIINGHSNTSPNQSPAQRIIPDLNG